MELEKLVNSIKTISVKGNLNSDILLLTYDSRNVNSNSIFFALKGTQTDGHQFINNVIEKGVKCIVCEVLPDILNENITYIQVTNTSESMALMAASDAWLTSR
jgi:UDP-N-acetylmuramoyl-L-alanyl-D-glutamate--2,6-diaminopimelate ligase